MTIWNAKLNDEYIRRVSCIMVGIQILEPTNPKQSAII